MSQLTADQYWTASTAMLNYGGSFAYHIASAWQVADSQNKPLIEAAFGPLFKEFLEKHK